MTTLSINPNVVLLDVKSGKLTSEGVRLISQLTQAVSDATSAFVRLTATQTLTNKTIDGDTNTLQDIATGSLKSRTGSDAIVVTGTAGTSGHLIEWDANGDAVDSGAAISNYLTSAAAAAAYLTQTAAALTYLTQAAAALTYLTIANAATTYMPLAGGVFTGPPRLPSYTVATVPAAATYARGLIYVSDESGGPTVAFSDGANWLRVQDLAIIS